LVPEFSTIEYLVFPEEVQDNFIVNAKALGNLFLARAIFP
jgi:hypothetical protein